MLEKVTKEEMAKELDCIIASIQYPPNVFTVWCRENSIVFAAFLRNTPRAKDFFNYGVIYNTILDLDKKIKFSIQKALELADELVFDKWNPFQSPSNNEYVSIYYIENAVFRISTLWDLLAQLFNIHAKLGADLDKIYATQLFHNAQQGKHADPFAKKVYAYMEQEGNSDSEPWAGNYKYVKELRDKLTHRISPNISSLSGFEPELRMPALYILKRVMEDYKQVSDFIHELLDKILADYKDLEIVTH